AFYEEISHDSVKKTVEFCIDLKDWAEASSWIDEFCLMNYFSFVVESTKKPTKFTLYKKYFRCAHNPRNKGKTLNSGCSANMIVTGRLANKKLKTRYPCVVELFYKHNHQLRSTEALQNRPVCIETQESLTRLLQNHGAKEALEKLKIGYGKRLDEICHDTAYCPNLQYVYTLQRQLKNSEANKTRIRRWIQHEFKKPAAVIEEGDDNSVETADEYSEHDRFNYEDPGRDGLFDSNADLAFNRGIINVKQKIVNYCDGLVRKLKTMPHAGSYIEAMLELLPNPSLTDSQFESQLETLLSSFPR
ncbi:unnamed protein product, partial [Lymnaea stagnalis]